MTTDKQRQQQKRWYELNAGPKGTIGNVLPLAPGAINPMWIIQKRLKKLAKNVAPMMKEWFPSSSEKTKTGDNGASWTRTVKVKNLDEEAEPIAEPLDLED